MSTTLAALATSAHCQGASGSYAAAMAPGWARATASQINWRPAGCLQQV